MEVNVKITKEKAPNGSNVKCATILFGGIEIQGIGYNDKDAMKDLYNNIHDYVRFFTLAENILGIKLGKNKYNIVKDYED